MSLILGFVYTGKAIQLFSDLRLMLVFGVRLPQQAESCYLFMFHSVCKLVLILRSVNLVLVNISNLSV